MKLIHIAVGGVYQNPGKEKNSSEFSGLARVSSPDHEGNVSGFCGEALE